MCGIFGIFSSNNSEDFFKKIKNKKFLEHRGPDNQSTYFDQNIFLYHSRLAIIDSNSSTSNQPMTDNSGRWKIVFNGEIYNYLEIKKKLLHKYTFKTNSDTEVLLASFILDGPSSLNLLKGMFSAVIYDNLNKKIYFFRDRYGIKPLIYTIFQNKIFFSSELNAFKKINLDTKLNINSLSDIFRYGSVVKDKTIYQNFLSIKPGYIYSYDLDNKIESKKYLIESEKIHQCDHHHLKTMIENSVKLNCVSDVDLGIMLSGGLDSNIILNYMRKSTNRNIKAYTLYFEGNHNKLNENDFASISAKHYGVEHESFELKNSEIEELFDSYIECIDQPSIDGFNTYVLTKKINREVKVVLSGLGGDEIFLGYDHYKNIINSHKIKDNLYYKFFRKINSYMSNPYLKNIAINGLPINKMIDLYREQFTVSEVNTILNKNIKKYIKSTEEKPISINQNLTNEISNYEMKNYLKNTLLRDSDVVAMKNSIELRPVFLDQELISSIKKLNSITDINNFKQKKILFDLFKKDLPSYFFEKNYRKKGFNMPFKFWLNNELKSYFLNLLDNPNLPEIFSHNFLESLRNKIKYHAFFRQKEWLYIVVIAWINKKL